MAATLGPVHGRAALADTGTPIADAGGRTLCESPRESLKIAVRPRTLFGATARTSW